MQLWTSIVRTTDLHRAVSEVLNDVPGKESARRGYPHQLLKNDLARLRDAWEHSQTTRNRDGIYVYLSAILELAEVWDAEGQLTDRAQKAHQRCFPRTTLTGDPFSLLILCSSERVHPRTRSKGSRVLHDSFASRKLGESLQDFVRRRGRSINGCSARYTARLRRKAARRQK